MYMTDKQYFKDYNKEYREKNKDKLKEQSYTKFNCEICGGRFTYATKSRHEKTKKHQLSLAYTEPCTPTL